MSKRRVFNVVVQHTETHEDCHATPFLLSLCDVSLDVRCADGNLAIIAVCEVPTRSWNEAWRMQRHHTLLAIAEPKATSNQLLTPSRTSYGRIVPEMFAKG